MASKELLHKPLDRTRQLCHLPDRRTLGYAEYGDPQGKPLFYFHGCPALASNLLA